MNVLQMIERVMELSSEQEMGTRKTLRQQSNPNDSRILLISEGINYGGL